MTPTGSAIVHGATGHPRQMPRGQAPDGPDGHTPPGGTPGPRGRGRVAARDDAAGLAGDGRRVDILRAAGAAEARQIGRAHV